MKLIFPLTFTGKAKLLSSIALLLTATPALAQTPAQVDAFLYDYEYRASRLPYYSDVLVQYVRSNPDEVVDLAIDYCVLLQRGFTMQDLIDQSTYNAGNVPEDQQMLFIEYHALARVVGHDNFCPQ